MPTDKENNAATPQYITSTWLVWKFQHSHGMSLTYHKLSRNFGGIVRYCSPHPHIHERLVKSRWATSCYGWDLKEWKSTTHGISLKLTSKTQRKSGMHSPHTLSPNPTSDSLAISYKISSKKKKNQWTVVFKDWKHILKNASFRPNMSTTISSINHARVSNVIYWKSLHYAHLIIIRHLLTYQ